MMPHGVALLCALPLVGCLAPAGDVNDESVDAVQQAALTNNALTNNALTNNALTNNALTNNALTNNALTNNALTNNALLSNALTDPNAREVFKYIVSCALPPEPGQLRRRRRLVHLPGRARAGGAVGRAQRHVQHDLPAVGVGLRDGARRLPRRQGADLRAGDTPALAASRAEQNAYTVREGRTSGTSSWRRPSAMRASLRGAPASRASAGRRRPAAWWRIWARAATFAARRRLTALTPNAATRAARRKMMTTSCRPPTTLL